MDRRQVSLGLAAGALMFAGDSTHRSAASTVCDSCPPLTEALGNAESAREIGGLAFEWIRFLKGGELNSPQTPALLQDATITDFVVISHGWHTDAAGAWRFYEPLLRNVSAVLAANPSGRKYAILGVQWPSKRFEEERDNPLNNTVPRQRTYAELSDDDLQQAIQQHANFTGGDAARLLAAVRTIEREGLGEGNYWALMNEIRASLSEPLRDDTEVLADLGAFVPPAGPRRRAAQALREAVRAPLPFSFDRSIARAQGMEADQFSRYRGVRAFLAQLFHGADYFEMKDRAGIVGGALAGRVLRQLDASSATRVHLIGHSFGARLVTSAAYHTSQRSKLRSLTLLQGAFSHNAMAEGGAFVSAFAKVSGPTLITHTHNDEALTKWYPIASALSGDTSQKLGGSDSRYGAIGANGAQRLNPSDVVSMADAGAVALTPGKVHNMNCDRSIHCHMDVTNAQVAAMVASALAV